MSPNVLRALIAGIVLAVMVGGTIGIAALITATTPATDPSPEAEPSDVVVRFNDQELVEAADAWVDDHLAGTTDELMGDGAYLILTLGSEQLGGRGDPRGVDEWATSGYGSLEEFAAFIDDYVAAGTATSSDYLAESPRLTALLQAMAQRMREMAGPAVGATTSG